MTQPTGTKTSKNVKRPKADFYSTPTEATEALMVVEHFPGRYIWESACGNGAISEVLKARGYSVYSTDLIDHGYGDMTGQGFLMIRNILEVDQNLALGSNVVTNPPYRLANEFVREALDLGTRKVAMLLKLSFLEGVGRSDILDDGRLARVHVFRNRLK